MGNSSTVPSATPSLDTSLDTNPSTRKHGVADSGSAPDPAAPYPLTARLEEIAAARSEATALSDATGAQSLTYGQLRRLWQGRAVPQGDAPVAVMGSTVPALAAAVAVLTSGRPLVLLDPQLPAERIRHILADSGADAVLADPASLRQNGARDLGAPSGPVSTTVVDDTWLTEGVRAGGGDAPVDRPAGTAGDQPATIVYTSGSTGLPKGVALSHACVVNGAATSRLEFALRPADRCALLLPPAYAAGQELLFMSLLNGCTLVSQDLRTVSLRAVGDWLRTSGVSTLHVTPSLLRHLSGALGHQRFDQIRLLTTCGEPIHGRDVAAAARWLPRASYANYLGSTETGHISFFHADQAELAASSGPSASSGLAGGPIPAGRPAPHKSVTVHDDTGRELPAGDVGRLRVTSPYLALGYWGESAASEQAFLEGEGARTFCTQDRGLIEGDGRLTLRGRGDDAVKIRGYLVEPAEVDTALRRIEAVGDCAVLAETSASARLIAYVVPAAGHRRASAAQVRARLREQLPEWMVPQAIVHLTELPRTERGKLDRAALPLAPARSTDTVPADQWESLVSSLWCRVLGLSEVGRDEDFFALGGDSLSVEEVLATLAERGIALQSSDLASAPTLSEFAALLRSSRVESPSDGRPAHDRRIQVRFRRTGTRTPVYCFSGAGGPAYLFAELAQSLPAEHPVSAFQLRGLEGRALPDWSVPAAARRYVRAITAQHPSGPIALVGHSLGGLIALEAAHRLRELGREVPLLTILDTVLPGSIAVGAGDPAPEVRIADGHRQSRAELWRTRFELLGAGWYPFRPATRDQVFFQHGLRLTERYRPTPWTGRTEVFLTPENIDRRSWWEQVLGDFTLHEQPCDHVALLRAPYVASVVDRLRSTLSEEEGPR